MRKKRNQKQQHQQKHGKRVYYKFWDETVYYFTIDYSIIYTFEIKLKNQTTRKIPNESARFESKITATNKELMKQTVKMHINKCMYKDNRQNF